MKNAFIALTLVMLFATACVSHSPATDDTGNFILTDDNAEVTFLTGMTIGDNITISDGRLRVDRGRRAEFRTGAVKMPAGNFLVEGTIVKIDEDFNAVLELTPSPALGGEYELCAKGVKFADEKARFYFRHVAGVDGLSAWSSCGITFAVPDAAKAAAAEIMNHFAKEV
ncbi:MAG: hypothetical protein WCT37_00795 [Patescibacteria group bacterium]|jgi:hypothetical protein